MLVFLGRTVGAITSDEFEAGTSLLGKYARGVDCLGAFPAERDDAAVISMSFGGALCADSCRTAFTNAYQQGSKRGRQTLI
jgi:hypothetical protein